MRNKKRSTLSDDDENDAENDFDEKEKEEQAEDGDGEQQEEEENVSFCRFLPKSMRRGIVVKACGVAVVIAFVTTWDRMAVQTTLILNYYSFSSFVNLCYQFL